MSKVHFYPSIAVDAICFIDRTLYSRGLDDDHINEVNLAKILLPENGNELISTNPSNFCHMLSIVSSNKLESLSLEDLIEQFENPHDLIEIVKTSEPYIDDDQFKKEVSTHAKQFRLLRDNGFEEHWRERLLPRIEEYINSIGKSISENDVYEDEYDELLKNISKMKSIDQISKVKVYVSYFSFPLCFKLNDNAFVTNTAIGNFFSLMAHELMHGFESDELAKLYREYMQSNDYLTETYRRLLDEWHSGDEEEFVKAAEYYLSMQTGWWDRDDWMPFAKSNYGGSCPVSVIVFDMLLREPDIPENYNKWLIEKFKNGEFPTGDIEKYVEEL